MTARLSHSTAKIARSQTAPTAAKPNSGSRGKEQLPRISSHTATDAHAETSPQRKVHTRHCRTSADIDNTRLAQFDSSREERRRIDKSGPDEVLARLEILQLVNSLQVSLDN